MKAEARARVKGIVHDASGSGATLFIEPLVAVEVFDEVRDAEVWAELGIPGSPFAVALGRDGAVRAKGTFNSYGQLESILATAERRVVEAHA